MRRILISAVTAFAACCATGYVSAQSNPDIDRANRGKAINPVTLNLEGKNANVVYLGSYLVNAEGGCNDCHSCPSYKGVNPFVVGGSALGPPDSPGPVNSVNYMAGGVPFGPIISPNLTPDASGKPDGLTFSQFANAILTGLDPDGSGDILQIMPWPVYRHSLTQKDLGAIYAYLSALPPAQPGQCTGSGQTGP